ncbi:MAG: YceI family protein, partial [Candidatus Acidiferrum sp.]
MTTGLLKTVVATLLLLGSSTAVWRAASPEVAPSSAGATQSASQIVLSVDAAHSAVHWTLDSSVHTVHGTFRVKGGTVSFDSATGKASGEIVVDAASGESGNNSRDHKMHSEVLESSKFTEMIFRPDRVEGTVKPAGNSTLTVYGTFSLHGAEHAFSTPVQVELQDKAWKASTSFGVPFLDWGLKNPSNFLLKVKRVVNVSVELSGSLQRSA